MSVSIRNFTRQPVPRLPFAEAAAAALPGWEVSLAFVGETRAQALNTALRNKRYVPNVLSYQAGEKSGEIIICPSVAAKQAPDFGLAPDRYCLLLFIHGLFHLKGLRHGGTMERRERALMARVMKTMRPALRFARVSPSLLPHGPTHRNRHRHRHLPGEAGRGRRAR
ncbi:MAG: rRNA maturation RNase YbeY [Patescibacteria group bacterium]|nr:rRNA maturation RNase YbeY [Patescibacteria group bacterium]MDE1943916.1 rRNA maturation RNase YbeY [Patescibacteria group bacterium]MDE1944880.1 rRNA maturation RNase YbeY [Patescibacteria group bacterium]MDE2057735.1 rRNA maturation RNase YbeY [Patescibacteria group bacterium]